MEDRKLFKDVPIGDTTYRVGKMTARNGSWVAFLIGSKIAGSLLSGGFEIGRISQGLQSLTESEFQSIQDHALKVVQKIDVTTQLPIPMMTQSGVWADKTLENDAVTVFQLTLQAVGFNLEPFFQDDGFLGMLGLKRQDSSPSDTQA